MVRDNINNGYGQNDDYDEEQNDSEDVSDGTSDHDDSEESASEQETGFFDLEASEEESEANSDVTDDATSFSKFTSLPKELQDMIWKFYCPTLDTKPRLIQLAFSGGGRYNTAIHVHPCSTVEAEPMLALLAVHRASRSLGLSCWPHCIHLESRQFIPYHQERDTVLCTLPENYHPSNRISSVLNEAAPGMRNLALNKLGLHVLFEDSSLETFKWLLRLPALRNVYVLEDEPDFIPTKALSWTASANSFQHYARLEEDLNGIEPTILQMVYSWPDPEKYRESEFSVRQFGALQLPEAADEDGSDAEDVLPHEDERLAYLWRWATIISGLREALRSSVDDVVEDSAIGLEGNLDTYQAPVREDSSADACTNIKVWPMACFECEDGLERLAAMNTWRGPWDAWESAEDEDAGVVGDEYESDGIDDNSLSDFIVDDDEDTDDMPAHLLETSSQVSAGNELLAVQFSSDSEALDQDDDESGLSSSVRLSHPAQHENSSRVVHAHFSEESSTEAGSPPSSTRRQYIALDDSDEEQEHEANARQPARNINRRVRPSTINSDDEDDDRSQQSTTRLSGNRGSRAIVVDSDEDEVVMLQSGRTGPRRARAAALPDSSDENDEEGDEIQAPAPSRTTTRNSRAAVQSNSEDESEHSSDEETAPAPAPRPTLAQRLAMEYQQPRARHQRTINIDDEDESDIEGYGGTFDDDEEGDASDGDELAYGIVQEAEDDDDVDEDGDLGDW